MTTFAAPMHGAGAGASGFESLLGEVEAVESVSPRPGSLPLGTAWLAGPRAGFDLAEHGYLEQECLISGFAGTWTWDGGCRTVARSPRAFATRVLVRRPADPTRFSGGVQLEPHHPDDDRALSWAMLAPWIVRHGHAHVGVTQEPSVLEDLSDFDPARYRSLNIPDVTQRYDILGLVAAMAKTGLLPALSGLPVDRVVVSGWSMTGTFWRTFLGEGFHDRCQLNGRPVNDAYLICISSGGAGRAGYASLRPDETLPASDRRRTIGRHGVPIIELLSEGESETHASVLRDDGDGPQDMYRLCQVAGTGHIATGAPAITTNRIQLRERGAPSLPREIVETPSDARMDLVARAVFDAVDRWLTAGVAPPRAPRLQFSDAGSDAVRGRMPESIPLARDRDSNAIGGVRTPWVEAPAASYLPHSTPRPGRCRPSPHAPYTDPALLADLIAHMRPFASDELKLRYGDSDRYLRRFEQAARDAQARGWLLEEDLPELLATRAQSVGSW